MSSKSTMLRALEKAQATKPGRPPNAIERIERIEAQMLQMVQQFNTGFTKLRVEVQKLATAVSLNTRVLDAITAVVGPQQVREQMVAIQAAVDEETIKGNEAFVAEHLASGRLVSVETPNTNADLAVVSEVDKDGVPFKPERRYIPMDKCPKELKELLATMKVGDSLPTPSGSTLTLLEAYALLAPDRADQSMAFNGGE